MDEGLFRIKKVSKKVRIVSQPRTNRLCVSAKSSVATKLRGALTDELTMSATV
jgi:prophage antirepressor-like protein